jgi:hypothetical protein
MRKPIVVCILALFSLSSSVAQVSCGFDSINHRLLSADPQYAYELEKTNAFVENYIQAHPQLSNKNYRVQNTYTIPLVVHVLHTGGAVGTQYNPSDVQIFKAIDYLNQVYNGTYPGTTKGAGDLQIQFVLASRTPAGLCTNGIDRVDASSLPGYTQYGVRYNKALGPPDQTIKDFAKWDVTKYYNIWVVNKIDGEEFDVGGYAYLPTNSVNSYDGIVMLANTIIAGDVTLPHEMGHAFNLYHTFEGSTCSGECPPAGPCDATGDYVCDTDPVTLDGFCRTGINSCTGLYYNDNTEKNFMSYAYCIQLFTQGQKARMLASLNLVSRQTLWSASNPAFIKCIYNDNCPGQALESSNTYNYIDQSFSFSTPSILPNENCDAGTSQPADIWYHFTARTGRHTVNIDAAGGDLKAVVSVYKSCGSTIPIACAASQAAGAPLSLVLDSLVIGNEYYIRIYHTGGNLLNPKFKVCITNNCLTPPAPYDLKVSVNPDGTATARWSIDVPPNSISMYFYAIGTSPDFNWSNGIQYNSISLRRDDLSLPCGGTYYFKVYGVSSNCNHLASPIGTSNAFTIPPCPCTPAVTPVNLKFTPTSSYTADFSWSAGNANDTTATTYKWFVGDSSAPTGFMGGTTPYLSVKVTELPCNTKLFFSVYAYKGCDGSQSQFATYAFTLPCPTNCITPAAPVNLKAKGTASNSATLSWSPGNPKGSNAVTYSWAVGMDTLFTNSVIAAAITTDTSVNVGLFCNRTYYARVYATTTCNNTRSASIISLPFKTDACPCTTPGAPVNVSASSTGQNSASLSWAQGSFAGVATLTYYWVVGTTPSVLYGSGVAQGITTTTSVSTPGLSCGTTYYLRVYAKTSCDSSVSGYATSTPFTTTACNCPSPKPPVNVHITAMTSTGVSSTSISVSWSPGNPPGTGNSRYYYVVGTSPNVTYGNGIAQGSTTDTSVTINSLPCGTSYGIRIYAQSSCDSTNSDYSQDLPFLTYKCCVTPAPPTNLKISFPGSASAAQVSWTKGIPAGSANVTYSWVVGTSPDVTYGNGISQGITPDTIAQASNLVCGQTYYLRVIAYTDCNRTSYDYSTSAAFIQPNPVKPVISASGNLLTSSSLVGNQWYSNASAIPGATGQDYRTQVAGAYTVDVTINGCTSALSDVYNFVPTAIREVELAGLTIYPNPVAAKLYFRNERFRKFKIQLYDVTGRLLIDREISSSLSTIDLSSLASSTYFLKVTDEKTRETIYKKIIKE